jgi:hypothetical protein
VILSHGRNFIVAGKFRQVRTQKQNLQGDFRSPGGLETAGP